MPAIRSEIPYLNNPTNKGQCPQGTTPPPNENPNGRNQSQQHRDTITIGIMTLATVVLAAMIGLLEISGSNPVRDNDLDPTSEGREQNNAPAPTGDESLSAVQRVAETIPGVVTLFATFALLLYVCCLFAGTDALLMSAREESDTAAIRYTQAIALFQGLVLLVVFIAGFSIFVSYVSGS